MLLFTAIICILIHNAIMWYMLAQMRRKAYVADANSPDVEFELAKHREEIYAALSQHAKVVEESRKNLKALHSLVIALADVQQAGVTRTQYDLGILQKANSGVIKALMCCPLT